MKVYYSMNNSLEYHGEDLQCCEIPVEMAPGVEFLIHSYPRFVSISELPLDKDTDKVTVFPQLLLPFPSII